MLLLFFIQGCGAFGAEVPLKALIQLLAATLAKRSIRYFTFASDACQPLPELFDVVQTLKPTVSQLYKALLDYHPQRMHGRTVGQYVSDLLDGSDSRKRAEFLAAQREREQAARLARQQQHQQAAANFFRSSTPTSARPGLMRSTATAAASPAARHIHRDEKDIDSMDTGGELGFDEDPIEDFPSYDQDDGYDSEAEAALREAEMMDAAGML